VSLKNCHLVYMECPIVEYNLGAPKLNDYLEFMKKLGFRPLKIFEQHMQMGVLIQIDIMFISSAAYTKITRAISLPKYLQHL
jgi:hypothetical protein